jgi:hypothetical protein
MTSNAVIPVWCGRFLIVWLKGPLEVVNSWVGPSSKATHQEVNKDRRTEHHWGRCTPVKMDFVEYPTLKPGLTSGKLDGSQEAGKYELSLLPPWVAGTMTSWGRSNWTSILDRFYGKCRLDSFPIGRILGSKSLWRWHINTIIDLLDIIHHPVFLLKKFRRLDSVSVLR